MEPTTNERAILDLYDAYRHTPMPRREFLTRLAALTGGAAGAAAWLARLEGDAFAAGTPAGASPRVPADAPDLEAGPVTYRGPAGEVRAYAARPRGARPAGGVLVIHENRGLNEHIRDVARRAARAGFHALAPDLLSRRGGTPQVESDAIAAIRDLPHEAATADLRAGLEFLLSDAGGAERVGAVGFCWGGGATLRLAVAEPKLAAAVSFYGPLPEPSDAASIRAPLLLLYAGNDTRVNAGLPAFEAALEKAGVRYELHVYPGVEHAFHNDTGAARYNAAAAADAWRRTVAFLREHLG